MTASFRGITHVVRELLAAGANVNATTSDETTALMHACGYSDSIDVMEALLNAGADPEARRADGQTALMWAASAGREKNVEVLLRRGADHTKKDHDGRTALDHARLREKAAVVVLLSGLAAKAGS